MDTLLVVSGLIGSLVLGLGVGLKLHKKKEAQDHQEYLQETKRMVEERKSLIAEIEKEIDSHNKQLEEAIERETSIAEKLEELAKENISEALSHYSDTLEEAYAKIEEKFDTEKEAILKTLEKMRATRAAAIEAAVREKQVQEEESFYKISISPADMCDIEILEGIKGKLRKPEVLCKLIWTTYYKKGTDDMCNHVVGAGTVSGVYKITDSTTGRVYIGQGVDISRRWKEHVKTALGANGNCPNNKLYAAMKDVGITNFTFEVLEKTAALNEKEKYWIDFYQSNIYGLNGTRGNN